MPSHGWQSGGGHGQQQESVVEEGDLADYLTGTVSSKSHCPEEPKRYTYPYESSPHQYHSDHHYPNPEYPPPSPASRRSPASAPTLYTRYSDPFERDAYGGRPGEWSEGRGRKPREGRPGMEAWIPGIDEPYFYSTRAALEGTVPGIGRGAGGEDRHFWDVEEYRPSSDSTTPGANVVWEDEHGRTIGAHGIGFEHHTKYNHERKEGGQHQSHRGEGGEEEEETLIGGDPIVARRLKRLEKVFGKNSDHRRQSKNGERSLGVGRKLNTRLVDRKGRLRIRGRKRRAALRWIQAIGALGVAGCTIGSGYLIKLDKPAPPQGTAPLYVIYVLSVFSFLLTSWRSVISPNCCGPRKHKGGPDGGPGKQGMMVLPIMPGGFDPRGSKESSGWCCCGGSRKDKRGGRKGDMQRLGGQQGVAVNLIVDPTMFSPKQEESSRHRHRHHHRRRHRRRKGKKSNDVTKEKSDKYESSSSSSDSDSSDDDDDGGRSETDSLGVPILAEVQEERMNPLQRLAYEAKVKTARRQVKTGIAWDVIMMLLWFGWVVWDVAFGKVCPPGEFQGWCNAFNVAIAAAVFVAITFAWSVYYGWKMLKLSRISATLA